MALENNNHSGMNPKLAGDALREFRPVMMWFWNSRLEDREIRRQIREFRQRRIYEFFVHTMYGLEVEYLSETFFEKIAVALDEAQKNGMKLWIYDEYGWPSGPVGGRLLKEHPDLRQKVLVSDGNGGVRAEVTGGVHAACRWSPFAWNQEGSPSNMNEKAIAAFIHLTHEQYYRRFKRHFGTTLAGFFSDEVGLSYVGLAVQKAIPWSNRLAEQFAELNGYRLEPHLGDLFHGSGDTVPLRYDYWRTAARAFENSFSRQIHDWCEARKVMLTGHLNVEESLPGAPFMSGDYHSVLRWFHIPGCDHIFSKQQLAASPEVNIAGKMASSVSHHTGRPRTLCETFTGSGWDLTFQDMKRVADGLAVLGVNSLQFMGAHYSVKGFRKTLSDAGYAPSHAYQSSLWKYYADYSDYAARVCQLNSLGRHDPSVALLYPITTLWCEMDFRHQDKMRDDETYRLKWEIIQNTFNALTNVLLANQKDFDVLSESALKAAEVREGKIHIGGEAFAALLLPAVTSVDREVWDKVLEFARQGGTLLLVNHCPTQSPHVKSFPREFADHFGLDPEAINAEVAGLFRGGRPAARLIPSGKMSNIACLISNDLRSSHGVLANRVAQQLEKSGAALKVLRKKDHRLWICRRALEPRSSATGARAEVQFLLINRSDKKVKNSLVTGHPVEAQKVDPETGRKQPLAVARGVGGKCAVPFDLEPYGSAFIRLKESKVAISTQGNGVTSETQRPQKVVRLSGRWRFALEDDNRLRLALWAKRKKGSQSVFSPTEDGRFMKKGGWLSTARGSGLGQMHGAFALTSFHPGETYQVRAEFQIEDLPERLQLAIEELGLQNCKLNGAALPRGREKIVWDESNIVFDIRGHVRRGKNIFEFETRVPEWEGPHALPMAALLGAFFVDGTGALMRPKKLVKAGSWAALGCPHYSGMARYSRDVHLPGRWANGAATFLSLEGCADVAELYWNRKKIGTRLWAPYVFDISGRIKEGLNELELRITNTSHNFYGKVTPPAAVNPTYHPRESSGGKLLPAGLLGGVSLRVSGAHS